MEDRKEREKMTLHDKGVLQVARSLLKKRAKKIQIGLKVRSHKKIMSLLKKEFPKAEITVG